MLFEFLILIIITNSTCLRLNNFWVLDDFDLVHHRKVVLLSDRCCFWWSIGLCVIGYTEFGFLG